MPISTRVRFEELILRLPGDELRVRFHEHLTVFCGIGMLERQAVGASVIGALTGEAESTVLTYTDATGRRCEASSGGGQVRAVHPEDGAEAPPLVGRLAPTAEALHRLMMVRADDLGLDATRALADEPPELAEARATLQLYTEELQAALGARTTITAITAELADVDAALERAEEGAARRAYAGVLAELERVRSEAAALDSGSAGATADQHLLAAAEEGRTLGQRWAEAASRLGQLADAFGDRPRLETAEAHRLTGTPAEPPADLPVLLAAFEAATAEVAKLDDRLQTMAASRLPDPSDPVVSSLARTDQTVLWDAHRRLTETGQRLRAEQVALGGASSAPGDPPAVVADIERAHAGVEMAERAARRLWVPGIVGTTVGAVTSIVTANLAPEAAPPSLVVAALIAGWTVVRPRLVLARAARKEGRALEQADVPTYLAFHMRRVDATVDPEARARLEQADIDHRRSLTDWVAVAGSVDPDDAGRLEAEVLSYAAALGDLGGTAEEIEDVRAALTGQAGPALDRARRALGEACYPYGTGPADGEPATSIERRVHDAVAVGHTARLQTQLEAIEAAEEKLASRLDELLAELGFADGELDERVAKLEWAVRRATERQAARRSARSRDEVEYDLARLQAEADRLRQPEWDSVTLAEADAPDVDELRQQRIDLAERLARARSLIPDVQRLADRCSAMERRVVTLEAQMSDIHGPVGGTQMADIHQYLLAALTQAAHAGPEDEPVPVVLDEPFLRIPAERKWDLLDMLRRLGEKTQLLYLTDDPFVAAWARRRAGEGTITLLEPVAGG